MISQRIIKLKYKNARDILPPELISQIQKYASGKLLYSFKNSINQEESKSFQKQKNEKSQTPLIFLFENGTFYLVDILDNQKLLNELKLKKINTFPAYIFIKNKEEYPSYLKNYGNPFHQAKIK